MFKIQVGENGRVGFSGRFDAKQAEEAMRTLDALTGPIVADLQNLDYISSAGLGVFLHTCRRLRQDGHDLRLVGLTQRVRNVFELAGFDRIMTIE